jgi:lipid II:glycine glycyltransferase (peptidoglycan interpeptide bridge formation enzyme)
MAGATIFKTDLVYHAQYISGSPEGRSFGHLDFLFDYLIKEAFENNVIFDFGICNELEGRKLNLGLLNWKEGFGGRVAAHAMYAIDTYSYMNLNHILGINE